MRYLRAVADFLWEFIVGDDWRVAAGLAATLAVTAGVNEVTSAWWLLPPGVVLVLAESLRRATRGQRA